MITYYQDTLRLFGFPVFTWVVAALFLVAMTSLVLGVARWKKFGGKVAVIASTLVLLAFALAAIFVLITIWSGSMG